MGKCVLVQCTMYGKFGLYNYSFPTPPILAKTSTAPKPSHMVRGPIGNRFVDLCGNRFVDLCGNWFVGLSETGSCPAPKGSVSFSEVGLRPTSLNLTKPLMAPAYRNWFVDLCVNRFVGA